MNKKINIMFSIIVLSVLIAVGIITFKFLDANDAKTQGEILNRVTNIDIVPTTDDIISDNSAWCPTFQLIWNDLKNEVVKQDIVFENQIPMVDNLNKESFTADMLSEEYYYKTYGLKTIELKTEIEKGIKEKFNQESDILNDFDWSEKALTDSYFFYSMLYKEFEFEYALDKFPNGDFADYTDVEYMGIAGERGKKRDKQAKQFYVLYHNNNDDFAIKLFTKSNDEVIFIKNPKGETFREIYDNMKKEESEYEYGRSLGANDFFQAPLVKINAKKGYEELRNETFETKDGEIFWIEQAIQSIQFSLDEKGGKVKSEAALEQAASVPRIFIINNTFALILKESDKDMPYFMSKITNIKDYQ